MDTIGLDLHKRESQLCIGRDDGSVEERRIVTNRERFSAGSRKGGVYSGPAARDAAGRLCLADLSDRRCKESVTESQTSPRRR
jgi:hypothetical protein